MKENFRGIYIFLIHVNVCPTCMTLHHIHANPMDSRKTNILPGTGVPCGSEMPYMC